MAFVQIIFDNAVVASVKVEDGAYATATKVLDGNPETASGKRELAAIAKLIEAGLKCAKPKDPSYDVQVTIQNVVYDADIKTLYPSTYSRKSGSSQTIIADVIDKLDSEVAKEIRQGTVCLFDLSYLSTDVRQSVVGGIHNTYPSAITLEYDQVGDNIHVILPGKHSYHRGAWYR